MPSPRQADRAPVADCEAAPDSSLPGFPGSSPGPSGDLAAASRRAVLGLWAAVVLVALGLGSAYGGVLLDLARRPRPGFLGPSALAQTKPGAPAVAAHGTLHLAGSGSNLPLTRRLAEAFAARSGVRVVVHPSIGSAGGIQAARDGVIDLGLISRPLSGEEGRLGLTVRSYARVAVVVAAHPTVPEGSLREADLLALVEGRRRQWRDGSPVLLLQRERGDSSWSAMAARIPGFSQACEEARRARRWPVLLTDASLQEALVATPGAVGIFDQGAIVSQGLPLKVLGLEGVEPSGATLASGAYPYYKDLAFVSVGAPRGAAAALLDWVASEEGRRLIQASGYLPLGAGPPSMGAAP